ncbi:MAG: uracil-DNA glycosylase [Acidobacteriota bacterium]
MADPSPDAVRQTLAYLRDIGWEDLYLDQPQRAVQAALAPAEEALLEPTSAVSEAIPSRASHATPPRLDAREAAGPRWTPEKPSAESVRSEATTPDTTRPVPARSQRLPSKPRRPVDSLSVEERATELEELAAEAGQCLECRLCKGRQSVVFGTGHANARLMLIGEGPGAEEDRQGLPFVGPAGELLNKILKAIQLERSKVYIANVVKCRPPRNRDPEKDEVTACRGFLERQIELVQPQLIVALGRVAAQALLTSNESLGRLRGRWHSVLGIPTRATYHPAALLRYAEYKRPTWEDMQLVRDRLEDLRSSAG